ncbi:acyl-CoA reductase [Roseomonas elaeocarpi]|uniref:Acyl-CoA reductase n=1 Tax=Roseomonas elaeocarpi TaxID=907779 RepID=A0ABV6JVU1_9PROT
MREVGGYLPPSVDGAAPEHGWRTEHFERGGQRLEVALPALDAPAMTALAGRIRDEAAATLRSMPVDAIAAAVDAAAERMLDRAHPLRQRAEQLLPIVTGYDGESVRLGLTATFRNFRLPQLRRFLAADLADPGVLDGFRPQARGGLARARGPALLLHVWAGNVPGLPVWGLVRGLLVKAGTIGKVSAAEPLLAGWFATLLAEAEPRLAGCLAILCWKGGADPAEQAAFDAADTVVAFGGNRTLAAIRNRLPGSTRFVGHGHKLSFGMVGREALTPGRAPAAANLVARDIARFEQQGCFAPQMIFAERGGAVDPAGFARHLAAALAAAEARHPRRLLPLDEAAALAEWRDREEARAVAQPGRAVVSAPDLGWCVSYADAAEPLRPAALNRSVTVVALDALEEAAALVAPFRELLQAAGVAAPPRRLHALAEALSAAGVTRIAALGAMTAPDAGWHNDGRFNLLDLLTITEIDPAAEAQAELYAPYAD